MEFENAKVVLWEAVNLDQKGATKQAIDKYIAGIEALLHCLSGCQKGCVATAGGTVHVSGGDAPVSEDGEGRVYGAAENSGGLNRWLNLWENIEKRNFSGHSYESIFAKCLDANVTEVHVEDPWLSSYHQLVNLVKFCELLVRNCPNLRRISLLTQSKMSQMNEAIGQLGTSLRTKDIVLSVNHEENMHDREIRFNNGWLVKMGRGLDIYKNVDKFSIGSHDYHLRPCKATLIEIFKMITSNALS